MNAKNSVELQVALIRAQVFATLEEANSLVPVERRVPKKSALKVVKRSLESTRGLAFEVREFTALRDLDSFLSLAHYNKSKSVFSKNTDLLPVSHPASTARHSMTASGLMHARAQWLLADERISETARPLLASAFTSKPGSSEYIYAVTRLNALPKGSYPLEALVAAFGDGNSYAARRARAMLQRRDRKGRFAYQGGGISALIERTNGSVERLTGKTVSTSPDGKTVRMETPGGFLVDVPLEAGEFIKAVINPTKDGYSGIPAEVSLSDKTYKESDLQKFDAPHGFSKDESYQGEGTKYTDDAYDVIKYDNGEFEVSRRGGAGPIGIVDSWAATQKMIQDDEPNLDKEEGREPIARLSEQDIEDMYDETKNPLDVKNPLGEEEEAVETTAQPKEFKSFTTPQGAFKLPIDPTDYEPEGYTDQDSTNYNDDPKFLSEKFPTEKITAALTKAILPKEDGKPATGSIPVVFNEGTEQVPAEAFYAALDQQGEDAQSIVAKIYDDALGTTENQDALEASREAAKATPKVEAPVAEIPASPEEVKATPTAILTKFDRPEGYDSLDVPNGELPATVYHVTSKKNADNISKQGLSVNAEHTWNTGASKNEKFEDNWIWGIGENGEWQKQEYRPNGVYVFGSIDAASQYAGADDVIYAIDTEKTLASGADVIRDPSWSENWDYMDDPEFQQAWVFNNVPPTALVDVTPAPVKEPDPADIIDSISAGDLTPEEIDAMFEGEDIGDADIEGDAPEEIKSKKAAKDIQTETPKEEIYGLVDNGDGTYTYNNLKLKKVYGKWIAEGKNYGKYDTVEELSKAILESASQTKPEGEARNLTANNLRKGDWIKHNNTWKQIESIDGTGLGSTINFVDGTSIDGGIKTFEAIIPKPDPNGLIDNRDGTYSYKGVKLKKVFGKWTAEKYGLGKSDTIEEMMAKLDGTSTPETTVPTPTPEVTPTEAVTPKESLPEIGGGWSIEVFNAFEAEEQAYVKQGSEEKYAFFESKDGKYSLWVVKPNKSIEFVPSGAKYLPSSDTEANNASPEEFDKIVSLVDQNIQNSYRGRLMSLLKENEFEQKTIDLVKTGSPEEIESAISSDPAYASLAEQSKNYAEATATNTAAKNLKGSKTYSQLVALIDQLKPLKDLGTPEEQAKDIQNASVPEMDVLPASAPFKTTVPVSELKAGDITFQEENPKYSGGTLLEPFTHYFVIEEVYVDENTPEGKVNIRGYFPGHESQVREWNQDTPIDVIKNDALPAKGDKPALERPKQKDEKYEKTADGKITQAAKAQWKEDITAYISAVKDSSLNYTDPVTDYIGTSETPEVSVPTVKKPWKPDAPAFQGSKLAELLSQAEGDPLKVKELLDNQEIIFFDFETDANTWDTQEAKPIQIAGYKVKNGEVVDSFSSFMNPEDTLGDFYYLAELTPSGKVKKVDGKPVLILDENGEKILKGDLLTPEGNPVDDAWLATQPSINEVMTKFFEWLGPEAILAGHNINNFDEPILRQQALNAEVEYNPAGFIDTLGLARSVKPNTADNTLGTLASHYKVDLENWHDASSDSLAVKGILDGLLTEMADTQVGLDQLDLNSKMDEYLKNLADYEYKLNAYQESKNIPIVESAMQGEPVPTVDELLTEVVPVTETLSPEGIVDGASFNSPLPANFPVGEPSTDSVEWVLDDNNTTLIEGKISPEDFQVGDFFPSKLAGFHEILSIEDNPTNEKNLIIKTRIVGTDKEYIKDYVKYNKSFTGVRRPNSNPNIPEETTIPEVAEVAVPTQEDGTYNTSGWTVINDFLGGSNGAKLMQDADGNQFVVKNAKSDKHAANEVLASALYAEAGLDSGRVYLGKDENGKTVLVSPWLEGSKDDFASRRKEPGILESAQQGFAVDAWLANYDSVGLSYDNMKTIGDKVVRVDPGGALLFRAQGEPKELTDTVLSIDSLRDPSVNKQAASVFGSMTDAQISDSVRLVEAITPERIAELVDANFPDDKETADLLKERLIARREDLIKKYPAGSEVTSETPTYDSSVVLIDPTKDIKQQLEDAIASGSKVAFLYNDKERLVTPKSIWNNPKNGKTNLRADDAEGVEKNYTISEIKKSNATISEGDSETVKPTTPETPAAEVSAQGLSDKASELKDLPYVEILTTEAGEIVVYSLTGFYKYVISPNNDGTYKVILNSNPSEGMGVLQDEDVVISSTSLDSAVKEMPELIKQMNAEVDAADYLSDTDYGGLAYSDPVNDTDLTDVIADIFDGVIEETPSIDELIPEEEKAKAITDPNLIFEDIKKKYPDYIELPNGELVVRRKEVVLDGIAYTYDTVVHRNENETFSVYFRETNVSTGETRLAKYLRQNHSNTALNNQIQILTNRFDLFKDPRTFMKKKKAKAETPLPVVEAPSAPTIADIASELEEVTFPKTDDVVINSLLTIVELAAKEDGGIEKVLASLSNFPGVSQEMVDNVTDIVNKVIANKATAISNTPKNAQGEVEPKTTEPYISADKVTILKVGDKVQHKNGLTGVVTELLEEYTVTAKGVEYSYSDYVKVQYVGGNYTKALPVNSNKLTVIGEGATPSPTPESVTAPETPKPESAPESQVATTEEQIEITKLSAGDNLIGYVVNSNKKQILVPQNAQGVIALTGTLPSKEIQFHELKPGFTILGGSSLVSSPDASAITVLDVDDSDPTMRKFTVHVLKQDGTHIKKEMLTGKTGSYTVVAYLPFGYNKNDEDGGGGNPPPEPEPINPTDGPATVQEAADLVDNISTQIKADPNMSGVDTDSMDSAVDSALTIDESSKAGLPAAPTAEEAISLDWYNAHQDEFTPAYFVKAQDVKPGDIVNGVLITSVSPYPNDEGYVWKENWSILKGILVSNGESTQSTEGTKVLDSVLVHKSSGVVDLLEKLPKIVPADVKNKKQYKGIKKLYGNELQIGDVIVGKGGSNPYSYQIISIVQEEGYSPKALVRVVSSNESNRNWWNKKNGSVEYIMLPQQGFHGSGYNNVKRPTEQFIKDTADKIAAAKLPKAPAKKKTGSKVQTFDTKVEVLSQGIDKTSPEFLSYVGAGDYSEYKSGMTGLFVKSSNDKYIMPGLVVSDENGNTGVTTNTNSDNNEVDVTWLFGPSAGDSDTVKSNTLASDAIFIKYEDASDLGVDIDTTVNDKSKAKIAAIQEQKAKAEAEAAEKAAKIAEYKKMIADNSVNGSGAENVSVPENLDWTTDVFEGLPSVSHIVETVQNDIAKASVGVQALVDSDSIEDNRIRIYRVQDTDGSWKTRVRFKLTDWAANNKIAENSQDAKKSSRLEFVRYEKQPDGSIKRVSTWGDNKIDGYDNGATYTSSVKNEAGEVIGEVLIHRANKNAETPDYGVSPHYSTEAMSYHNEVDIYLPDSATPEQIKLGLEKAGVIEARPATKEDVKITIENKIISLFGDKSNGSKNYSGELRAKVLEDVKKKYGLSAEDVVPVIINNGDITFLMPEEVADKLALITNATFFNHNWTSSNLPSSGKERAKFFFELLTSDGLRSTVERWAAGTNISGMSSVKDGYGVGANYVFTSKSSSPGGVFSFDGKKLLRRLDFYANGGDSFGQKKDGKDTIKEISAGYVYEILFKGTISWADLAKINLDSATRDALIELLTDAGIDIFGGTPLNKIFGV